MTYMQFYTDKTEAQTSAPTTTSATVTPLQCHQTQPAGRHRTSERAALRMPTVYRGTKSHGITSNAKLLAVPYGILQNRDTAHRTTTAI